MISSVKAKPLRVHTGSVRRAETPEYKRYAQYKRPEMLKILNPYE